MKGDFSRDTFNPAKHFSRVLMQQGRVQLDADANEQAAILLHYLRTLAADLIGPFGGPASDPKGFEIIPDGTTFKIGKGRYYVDGILCENEGEEEITYDSQVVDYPNAPPPETGKPCLVYLDVWERHITSVEDDYIREKALGGADTASRAKVVWQVKIQNKVDKFPELNVHIRKPESWVKCIDHWQPEQRGCLKARVKQSSNSNDPCLTPPEAKYRGSENQLYRVEIHTGGDTNSATFKWSRDNGAIVTGINENNGKELTLEDPRGFVANGWVELTNDGQELRGKPGTLVKVSNIEGNVLILENDPGHPSDLPQDEVETWPTKVRRWDQVKGVNETGTIKLHEKSGDNDADWVEFELEHGIQIQFQPSSGCTHRYRTGDYWLIPARVATGDIEWLVKLKKDGITPEKDSNGRTIPCSLSPHGIHHHYAPLAILTKGTSGWEKNVDLRCKFQPLNYDCDLSLSYSYGEMGIGGHLLCDSCTDD